MTSKSKNGGDSWGILYGRPMEALAFCYDRHEGITRYIRMRNIYYHPTVMHVFCIPLKFFGWFCYSRCHTVQFNILYVSQDMYTDFFTLILGNYFRLNNFLYKSPQLKPPFLLFVVIADKVHTVSTQPLIFTTLL